MHGYNHIYGQKTYKKDYFRYGGRSEFYGEPLHIQLEKINKGLEIFKKNKINIRSFFAPNHTYDENTFVALKKSGIYLRLLMDTALDLIHMIKLNLFHNYSISFFSSIGLPNNANPP